MQRFLSDLRSVRPRPRYWAFGLGLALLYRLADATCFVLACLAVDMPIHSLVLVMTAYLAGISAGTVSPLPGGLGTMDAAMVLVLVHGGVGDAATAGVLSYRLVSFVLVVTAGWLVFLWLRLTHRDEPTDTHVQPDGTEPAQPVQALA